MKVVAVKHITSVNDFETLLGLGYSIVPDNANAFCHFINSEYANFDIAAWLKAIHPVLDETTELEKDQYVMGEMNEGRELLCWFGNVDFDIGKEDLMMIRKFYKNESGKICVYHTYLTIPEAYRNQGRGKTILRESLQQYVNMKLETIFVHAALEGGGWAWARYGFVATNQTEITKILDAAMDSDKLSSDEKRKIKAVYDRYYDQPRERDQFPIEYWAELQRPGPHGPEPVMKEILRGSRWHGRLDLTNEENFSTFRDYVYKD